MIRYYADSTREISVTEFGHTRHLKEKTVPMRTRSDYILHLVVSGELRFMGQKSLTGGHALLIVKGCRHAFTVHPPYEHYWIAFCGGGVPSLLRSFNIDPEMHECFVCRDFDRILAFFEKAFLAATDASDDGSALSALLSLLPLLSTQVRIHTPQTEDAVAAAELFIRRNIHRAIAVGEIADCVHLSAKHLCRLFIKAHGVSLKQFVLRIKMDHATDLLANTDLYIKEVAASVGFPSQLAFSAAYRKARGMSPTEARNLARKSGKRT